MVYLGSKASFSINMNKIAAPDSVNALWIDPKTGDSLPAGSYSGAAAQSFSTPDGWQDAILILPSSGASIDLR